MDIFQHLLYFAGYNAIRNCTKIPVKEKEREEL